MRLELRANSTWFLLMLFFGIAMKSDFAYAGKLTIEGGRGLAVPVDFVLHLFSSGKFEKHLNGKKLIESKIEITYPGNAHEHAVIAAIPGLLEQPTVDYVLRAEQQCMVFITNSNGEIDWRRINSFKCPSDTLSLVKERAECASGGGTWDVSLAYPAGWACIPENRQSCAALGGIMRRICMSQVLTCVKTFNDAKKPCTDGTQCEGNICIDVGNKASDDGTVLGQCKINDDPCGSFSFIKEGKRGARMHVD